MRSRSPWRHHITDWRTVEGAISKCSISESTFQEALEEITEMLSGFKYHCFIKWIQQSAFEKAHLLATEKNVVVHVDYAENFNCLTKDEITAKHFQGGPQVITIKVNYMFSCYE
jgi:hypothetical protein